MKSFIVTALFLGFTGTVGLMAQSTGRGNAETAKTKSETVKVEEKKKPDDTRNGRSGSKETQGTRTETHSGHAYGGGHHKHSEGDKGNGHHDHADHNAQKRQAPGSQRQSTGTQQKSR